MANSPVIANVTAPVDAGKPAGPVDAGKAAGPGVLFPTFLTIRAVLWTAVMLLAVASLVPISGFVLRELKTWSLIQADEQTIRIELNSAWPKTASAGWLEALAEFGLQVEPAEAGLAHAAAMRATAADPSRAGAWALLAHLESQRAKQVNGAALDALAKSMDACPLCSEELIRWRLNFVLANWNAVPDKLRRRAFEHADLLRWMGANGEFLAEMRVKAQRAGIPFEEYRSAVNTPARTWDLAPAGASGTPSPAAGG